MDYNISKITPDDYSKMRELSANNGGNLNLSESYIHHWYEQNPIKSTSLWKLTVEGEMEGFATSNNFLFTINHEQMLIAMPQNLLTSFEVRGKGFFEKLYKKTEQENRERNGADGFIVFSNELSSAIFLQKFGYVKAHCPDVFLTFFSLKDLFSKAEVKRLDSMGNILFKDMFHFNNAMHKPSEYFKWRYSFYSKEQLHIIEVKKNEVLIGYAFLKKERKKGISFLILMDILVYKQEYIPNIVRSCSWYTSKHLFAGMLQFEIPDQVPGRLHLTFKSRFNVLVKRNTQESSIHFSKTPFQFFFGDLDIV